MNCKYTVLFGAIASLLGGSAQAEHDIEFVAEHLPEVMMDNRYATLPIWDLGAGNENTAYQLQGAYPSSAAGDLSIAGPLLAMSVSRPLGGESRLGAFGFYDPLRLRSNFDSRPLQTLFAPQTPLARPVAAEFTDLDGSATDFGAGLFWSAQRNWVAGVLWQRVDLQDYRFDYLITEGPQSGLQGQIDFDTHYDHFTPFVGFQFSVSAAIGCSRRMHCWRTHCRGEDGKGTSLARIRHRRRHRERRPRQTLRRSFSDARLHDHLYARASIYRRGHVLLAGLPGTEKSTKASRATGCCRFRGCRRPIRPAGSSRRPAPGGNGSVAGCDDNREYRPAGCWRHTPDAPSAAPPRRCPYRVLRRRNRAPARQ